MSWKPIGQLAPQRADSDESSGSLPSSYCLRSQTDQHNAPQCSTTSRPRASRSRSRSRDSRSRRSVRSISNRRRSVRSRSNRRRSIRLSSSRSRSRSRDRGRSSYDQRVHGARPSRSRSPSWDRDRQSCRSSSPKRSRRRSRSRSWQRRATPDGHERRSYSPWRGSRRSRSRERSWDRRRYSRSPRYARSPSPPRPFRRYRSRSRSRSPSSQQQVLQRERTKKFIEGLHAIARGETAVASRPQHYVSPVLSTVGTSEESAPVSPPTIQPGDDVGIVVVSEAESADNIPMPAPVSSGLKLLPFGRMDSDNIVPEKDRCREVSVGTLGLNLGKAHVSDISRGDGTKQQAKGRVQSRQGITQSDSTVALDDITRTSPEKRLQHSRSDIQRAKQSKQQSLRLESPAENYRPNDFVTTAEGGRGTMQEASIEACEENSQDSIEKSCESVPREANQQMKKPTMCDKAKYGVKIFDGPDELKNFFVSSPENKFNDYLQSYCDFFNERGERVPYGLGDFIVNFLESLGLTSMDELVKRAPPNCTQDQLLRLLYEVEPFMDEFGSGEIVEVFLQTGTRYLASHTNRQRLNDTSTQEETESHVPRGSPAPPTPSGRLPAITGDPDHPESRASSGEFQPSRYVTSGSVNPPKSSFTPVGAAPSESSSRSDLGPPESDVTPSIIHSAEVVAPSGSNSSKPSASPPESDLPLRSSNNPSESAVIPGHADRSEVNIAFNNAVATVSDVGSTAESQPEDGSTSSLNDTFETISQVGEVESPGDDNLDDEENMAPSVINDEGSQKAVDETAKYIESLHPDALRQGNICLLSKLGPDVDGDFSSKVVSLRVAKCKTDDSPADTDCIIEEIITKHKAANTTAKKPPVNKNPPVQSPKARTSSEPRAPPAPETDIFRARSVLVKMEEDNQRKAPLSCTHYPKELCIYYFKMQYCGYAQCSRNHKVPDEFRLSYCKAFLARDMQCSRNRCPESHISAEELNAQYMDKLKEWHKKCPGCRKLAEFSLPVPSQSATCIHVQRQYKQKVCYEFVQSKTHCRLGRDCHYSHRLPQDIYGTMCKKWIDNRECSVAGCELVHYPHLGSLNEVYAKSLLRLSSICKECPHKRTWAQTRSTDSSCATSSNGFSVKRARSNTSSSSGTLPSSSRDRIGATQCKFFLRGNCTRGNACKFAHSK